MTWKVNRFTGHSGFTMCFVCGRFVHVDLEMLAQVGLRVDVMLGMVCIQIFLLTE